MIDCLTTPDFAYFIGLLIETVEIVLDGTQVTIHAETGPVVWQWIEEGDQWCMQQ